MMKRNRGKISMFSRVMKEKGIVDAIETVHNYNGENSWRFRCYQFAPR